MLIGYGARVKCNAEAGAELFSILCPIVEVQDPVSKSTYSLSTRVRFHFFGRTKFESIKSSLSSTIIIIIQSAMLSVVVVSLLATWLVVVDAYPSGPPLSACRSMVPTGHGTSTLSGETPFTITTNTTFYTAGEQIEVTISGARFVGFFVQARRRDTGRDTNKGIGTMTPGNTDIGKTLNCDGGTANAWSHKSNAAKTSETAIWTAPSSDEGKIAFRATIVQGPSSDRYWTDVYSANLPFGAAPSEDQTTPAPTGSGHVYCSSLPLLLVSCAVAAMNRL